MKPFKIVNCLSILALSLMSLNVGIVNAEVKLKLINGEKFRDYKSSGQTSKQSLKTVKKQLSKLFTELSEKHLEKGLSLEIEVVELDLPGIYHYGYGSSNRDIRVIDTPTPYQIKFNYKLLDSNSQTVKEGEYKIKDFYDSPNKMRKNRNKGAVWYYEDELVKWFESLKG